MTAEYHNKRRQTVIALGENVFLPAVARITVPRFEVGDHTRINGPLLVHGQEDCSIGKYCALGYNVTIVTTNHDITRPGLQLNFYRRYGFRDLEISRGPVTIGHSVWIGDNATILSGVNIGHGSIIGAGAVVTGDLPACSVVVGLPARVIRFRINEKLIDQYLDLAWWDWPEDKIARNRIFFDTDLSAYPDTDLKKLIVD